MSLLTFERPTCGQVIGSTMTRLWLRFYAGSRRINEPAYHDERWWLWISIITIPFVFIATHYCSKQHYFHDTSIVFFFLAGTVRKTHICTLSHALNTPLTTHQKAFRVFFFIIVCFVCVLAYYTTITITTTTRQCRSLCCSVSISVCHVVYYFIIFCGLHRIPGS